MSQAGQLAASRRFALRAATGVAHAALDAEVGDLATPAAYRRYLAGLHRFRAPVEAGLAAAVLPPGFGGWRPIPIATTLAADAADIGLDLAPAGAPAPAPATASGLLGLCYVLEGSALGARLLQRQAAALGFDARCGARHLAAQTASPEPWRRFCALLEAWPEFAPDAAFTAADAAFARARRAFADDCHATG